ACAASAPFFWLRTVAPPALATFPTRRSSDLGVPGAVAGRDPDPPDRDALPQSRLDGRGGIDPRLPHRRRGAADGLRQDHAFAAEDRKSTRLNSSHVKTSYAVFCLKKKRHSIY